MNIQAKPSTNAAGTKAAGQRVNYAQQSPDLLKKFTEFLAATREARSKSPFATSSPSGWRS